MIQVNIRQTREKLSRLLAEAERGRTITITRRGRVVAQIVPPPPQQSGRFPDLTAFRDSIKVKPGTPEAAKLVRQMRDEERS